MVAHRNIPKASPPLTQAIEVDNLEDFVRCMFLEQGEPPPSLTGDSLLCAGDPGKFTDEHYSHEHEHNGPFSLRTTLNTSFSQYAPYDYTCLHSSDNFTSYSVTYGLTSHELIHENMHILAVISLIYFWKCGGPFLFNCLREHWVCGRSLDHREPL